MLPLWRKGLATSGATGMLEPILADQLPLSQPAGADYARYITTCPPPSYFQTFLYK